MVSAIGNDNKTITSEEENDIKAVLKWNGDEGIPFDNFYISLKAFAAKKQYTYLFKLANYSTAAATKKEEARASDHMIFVLLSALTPGSFQHFTVSSYLEPVDEADVDLVPAGVPRFYYAWQAILKDHKPKIIGEATLVDQQRATRDFDSFKVDKTDDVRTKLVQLEAIIKRLKNVGINKTSKEHIAKLINLLEPLSIYSEAIRDVHKLDRSGKLATEEEQAKALKTFQDDVSATYRLKKMEKDNTNSSKDDGDDDEDLKLKTHDELLVLVGNLKKQLNTRNKKIEKKKTTTGSAAGGESIQGCNHCKEKGYQFWYRHDGERCWKLHPELKPAIDGTITPDPERLGLDGVPKIGT
jgi:hypothetical protein